MGNGQVTDRTYSELGPGHSAEPLDKAEKANIRAQFSFARHQGFLHFEKFPRANFSMRAPTPGVINAGDAYMPALPHPGTGSPSQHQDSRLTEMKALTEPNQSSKPPTREMSQSEVRKQKLIIRIQAGATLLLLLACTMLILRDRRRTAEFAERALSATGERQDVTSIERPTLDSVARLRQEQNAVGLEAPAQPLVDGRSTVLTPEVIKDTRYANLKLIALHYAKYFATAKLTGEKAQMLLDLLVDQSMVLVEAGPQTGSANEYRVSSRSLREQAAAQNRALIEQLVGADEAGRIEAAAAEQRAAFNLRELVDVIGGADPVPPDVQQKLPALMDGFDAGATVSRFLGTDAVFTVEAEASLRAEYARDLTRTISRMQTVLKDEQVKRFREVSDQKFEGGLLLLRILAKEREAKGSPGVTDNPGDAQ